jgi:hypothetical protein
MNREQLDLVRQKIPLRQRHVKGHDLHTLADLCLACDLGALRRVFLFRTDTWIFYALEHIPGLSNEPVMA